MRYLILLVLLSGCAHLEWECPEVPVVRMEDTRTIVRCVSADRSVTIRHPVGTTTVVPVRP